MAKMVASVHEQRPLASSSSPHSQRTLAKTRRDPPIVRDKFDYDEDGELIPKTKNKQRRQTGEREDELNLYYVSQLATHYLPIGGF